MQTPSDNANRSHFKKSDIIIIGIVLLVGIAGYLFIEYQKSQQDNSQYNYVAVNINGKDMAFYDLAEYTESEVIDLNSDFGINAKMEIRDHEARLIEVDCPDKLCEKAGFVRGEMDSAVCLPNKLMLRVYLRDEVPTSVAK